MMQNNKSPVTNFSTGNPSIVPQSQGERNAESHLSSSADETSLKVNNSLKKIALKNSDVLIERGLERPIFHLKAPCQLEVFKSSTLAKASKSSEYCAQYTTCGWLAAFLVDSLCRILSKDITKTKKGIQHTLERLAPDKFIRYSTRFVGDLTAYGGSDDKVEGLLLGEDIYAILRGTNPPCLANVFVIEGAAENSDLETNEDKLTVFNAKNSFRANYKNPSEFFPIKKALRDVSSGKKPFAILISLETFPVGKHFVTYTFRKDSKNSLECLIFEGLNEKHRDWVSFEKTSSEDQTRRSTSEWIYNELIQKKVPFETFSKGVCPNRVFLDILMKPS